MHWVFRFSGSLTPFDWAPDTRALASRRIGGGLAKLWLCLSSGSTYWPRMCCVSWTTYFLSYQNCILNDATQTPRSTRKALQHTMIQHSLIASMLFVCPCALVPCHGRMAVFGVSSASKNIIHSIGKLLALTVFLRF